ncbi:hypothetical protein [Roseibium aquae]|nr:hypothetical protein [Roseibium aquae]
MRFADTMSMARREQDYRDDDEYAEEFIRPGFNLGQFDGPGKPESSTSKTTMDRSPENDVHEKAHLPFAKGETDRVRVRERNGIWEIRVDRAFFGDHNKPEHAWAAAALATHSIR